ncbi:hypothetical protein CIHG_01087 [Coccidioides immitis H538.4]|uniref:Uncharacterized protein n=1 Tax=Coccidioides immitis H538.4 TaxID=396776 RepID=A0A0J8RDM3_COCIT|nr:hypothetical protein CIHG_01087 [Coccidioides immitis H538.4]
MPKCYHDILPVGILELLPVNALQAPDIALTETRSGKGCDGRLRLRCSRDGVARMIRSQIRSELDISSAGAIAIKDSHRFVPRADYVVHGLVDEDRDLGNVTAHRVIVEDLGDIFEVKDIWILEVRIHIVKCVREDVCTETLVIGPS